MGFLYRVELRALYARLVVLVFSFQCGSNLGIGLPGQLSGSINSTSAEAGFIREPKDAFVFKNYPATLTCTAKLVSKLEFNCSGGVSRNNVRYRQDAVDVITLSTRIYRYMIKSFGRISCFCVAEAPSGAVLKSRTANFTLALAYLKDNIVISPSSGIRVQENQTISLSCKRPKGLPEPTVTWLKDGITVTTSNDGRVQIKEDANSSIVVIQKAVLSDTAAYQCVALNLAGMQESAMIPVTVIVDGGWSGWSEFSKCDAKCGNGTKMLKRSCTNPSPANGGQLCRGRRIKVVPCQDICADIEIECPEAMKVPVNRSNVAYANVSWQKPHVVNNKNGTKFTLRVIPVWAKPPMPLLVSKKAHVITYVARHESGQEARCSINITVYNSSASILECKTCDPDKTTPETPGSGPQDAPSSFRVLWIVGATVVVLSLLSVALSRAIYLHTRRKSRLSRGPTVQEKHGIEQQLLFDSISPLVTRSGSYVEAMGRYTELKTQQSTKAEIIDLYPVNKEHIESSQTVPEIKEDLIKSKTYDRSNSCASNKSTVSEISRMMWNVSNLPENADPKLVAWGLIDHNGGKLEIGDTGITLTVPQLAIPKGHTEGIYIALMKQDGEHPKLTAKESILSPVVMCGPSGIKFNRPVILSMPHCALLQDGAWNLKVQCNENEPSTPAEWKQLIDVNKQDGTDSSFVVMEPKMCHLMVDHFTDYVLTGESATEKPAVRMVQIVAYVTPPEVNKDCVVRVYCVADTPAALETVHNQEIEKFGGETIDAPKPLFFKDGGGNLIVNLLSNQEDWENISGDKKKIRFLHIWNGIDRMPSCTYVFSTSKQGVTQFRGTFEVRQDCDDGDEQEVNVVVGVKKGSNDKSTLFTETTDQSNTNLNGACTLSASIRKAASVASLEDASAGSLPAGPVYSTRRSLLQLDTDGARAFPNPVSPAVSPIDLKHLSFSSGYSSNGCQSLLSVHSMPQELRNDLVFALDPSHDADWKLLAEKLGFESKHIRWLESRKDSPTETLLNWWEMKRSRKFPLRRLAEILREIGRDDAASLIEAQLPRETVV